MGLPNHFFNYYIIFSIKFNYGGRKKYFLGLSSWLSPTHRGERVKWKKFRGYFAISKSLSSTYKYVNHCSQFKNFSQTLAKFLHKIREQGERGEGKNLQKPRVNQAQRQSDLCSKVSKRVKKNLDTHFLAWPAVGARRKARKKI